MKIGIIGATGKAGSLIMKEAVKRELDVTAIIRSPEKLGDGNFQILKKDASEIGRDTLKPFDVVINALGFPPEQAENISKFGKMIIEEADKLEQLRFIAIGHAGTLFKDEERKQRLFEGNSFPEDFKPTAENHLKNLQALEATDNLKWTFICPASFFDPDGAFTGNYQAGSDIRIKNSQGKSYISYADFASAVVDEAVQAKHENEQISTAGEKES